MNLDKRNGYFVTSTEVLRDPIRSDHWKLNFDFSELRKYEMNLGVSSNTFNDTQLSLTVKDYTPPTISMNTEPIFYQGASKKVLPSSYEYEDTLVVTMLETSDLVCHKNIIKWMQYIIQNFTYSTSTIGEETTVFSATDYTFFGYGAPVYKNAEDQVFGNFFINHNTVYADIFDYTSGDSILRVKYVNIFPVKVTQPKLEYSSSNLYEFTVEFKYSRSVYVIPTKGFSVSSNQYNSQTASTFGRNSLNQGGGFNQ